MRRTAGFTLVELLVVIAIMVVLFSIAVPSYNQYRIVALRGAAKAVLMDLASRQEVVVGQRGAYVSDSDDSGVILGFALPDEVYQNYKIEMVAVASITGASFDMPGFTITATPRATSPQLADGSLSVNQFGLRLPAGKW